MSASVTPEQRAAEYARCRKNGHSTHWLPFPFDPCPVGEKVLRPYIDYGDVPVTDRWLDAYEPMLVLGADEREFLVAGSHCDHCGHTVPEARNPYYGWWKLRTLDPLRAGIRVMGSDAALGEHEVMEFPPTLVRAVPCVECRGRGWNVGECHPEETCGTCAGAGLVPAPRPLLSAVTVQVKNATMVCNRSTSRVLFLHVEEVFDEARAMVLEPGTYLGVEYMPALYATWAPSPDPHPEGAIFASAPGSAWTL